jgi:glutamate dehydrogenase/leucine dehydrogenase
VINQSNKDRIQAKIIVEAANIPMPENVEEELFERGILIVPDFIANVAELFLPIPNIEVIT